MAEGGACVVDAEVASPAAGEGPLAAAVLGAGLLLEGVAEVDAAPVPPLKLEVLSLVGGAG